MWSPLFGTWETFYFENPESNDVEFYTQKERKFIQPIIFLSFLKFIIFALLWNAEKYILANFSLGGKEKK